MSKIAKKDFSGEIEPLAGNEILTKPVKDMTVPERAQAHVILKFMEKRIKARLEQIHDPLMTDAKQHGEPVVTDGKETGSWKLYVEGSKVYNQKRVGKEPDYQKMVDLLAAKKIDVEKAYDKVVTYVYNPSKVNALIEAGYLKRAEVDAFLKIVHALVVEPSPELTELMKTAGQAALEGGD